MKLLPYLFTLLLLSIGLAAHAEDKKNSSHFAPSFVLDPIYQRSDGTIRTWTSGNVVDPYFPTKALLIAQDNGMDISAIGQSWIEWLMAKQEANGLFSRYCPSESETNYEACSIADADDSMMAMWVELLYRMAPRSGLPPAWKASAEKALYQLDSIYDPHTTVFFVSKSIPVGLLMDNIEIYAAFKRIQYDAQRIGDTATAAAFRTRANQLQIGIAATFWDGKAKAFKASTQIRPKAEFYPDTVAQLIPLLHNFHSSYIVFPHHFYKKWMQTHRKEWFSSIGKDYPWGLLAVLAVKQGDMQTAACWLQLARPSRHQKEWDVLDETAFQIVDWSVQKKFSQGVPACKKEVIP